MKSLASLTAELLLEPYSSNHPVQVLPGLFPVALHEMHFTQLVQGIRRLAVVRVLAQQQVKDCLEDSRSGGSITRYSSPSQ